MAARLACTHMAWQDALQFRTAAEFSCLCTTVVHFVIQATEVLTSLGAARCQRLSGLDDEMDRTCHLAHCSAAWCTLRSPASLPAAAA